jgi:integrase
MSINPTSHCIPMDSQGEAREGGELPPGRELCNRLHGSAAEQVAFYLGASRASATHRAYAADLAAFRAWGGTVPTTPEVTAAYLATHAALAASTLRRRLAAIADAHQSGGHPDPTKAVLVRKVLRGICRIHGVTRSAAAPLDIATLARVVGSLSRDLLGLRDRALLLVGFFAALRRAELVGLEVSDVALAGGTWTITIRRSKTDQYGVGQVVALPLLESPLCPVTALQGWLLAAGITAGPVFRTIDGKGYVRPGRLPSQEVGRILRLRATEAGVVPTGLSAHSLRSGFAVSAVRAGVGLPLIQAVTRHSTLAGLEPYVRAAGPPTTRQIEDLVRYGASVDA